MSKKKKVLIVDDSAFMRRVISDIINSDERCEVIGVAKNGKEGLELANQLMPDVITLDVQMPIMNGLEMLKQLNIERPTPVIMLSTLMKEGGKETIEALELGAYDFVRKPDNIFKINSDDIKDELITKVIEASESGKKIMSQFRPSIQKINLETKSILPKQLSSNTSKVKNLVALGTSTGGPRALQFVIPYLPKNINAAIVVVQHMPPGFTKSLSERLNQLSQISVKEAEDKDIIENGKAYVAPGDRQLEIREDKSGNLVIHITDDPPKGGHKPAVNVMMNSVAEISTRKLIGVIMTGMGSDGMEGMQEVKSRQKMHIIAQNEETCVVYGMPKSVVEKGIADEVVPLEKIAESILKQSGVL
ncbi:MAG: chemotaxis response regulator protein-glutamate methylesterase [Firmicutes bacterium HGW-Firmicutes-1]|nr:MAG: chemotaxis response regulator protein-glutamate methylesterase [Firmicutes bacterium HGW-Firmicutes-1]